MVVEYMYNAIKAVAGQDITIYAYVTDNNEQIVTTGCCFMLHDKDGKGEIADVPGVYLPDHYQWEFTIPAAATEGLEGHYWYCIQHNDSNLCFRQPIYLV